MAWVSVIAPQIRTIAFLVLPAFFSFSLAFAAENMQAFPPAEAGMTRHVINLPQQEDETAFKVELIVGKTVKTDARNRYFFGGAIETESIPGWGFDRYTLRKLGPMAGTLMGIDPNAPLVERFVSLGGEPRLLRYNSRLPLVVYVPAGVEVRHRIWHRETGPRFVQKLALPTGQAVVIAEGEFEARSIGSYSVRLYSTQRAQPGDDTTFYASGVLRKRDGTIEKAWLADLDDAGSPGLIVAIRSVGSGGYLTADAFTFDRHAVVLHASVSGLSPDADPVAALQASLRQQGRK
jgi:ecotin